MPQLSPGQDGLRDFFARDQRSGLPRTAVRIIMDTTGNYVIGLDLARAYTREAAENIARALTEVIEQAYAADGITRLDASPVKLPLYGARG